MTVFYTVSLACVVTNVMILFFTSDALCEWIDCHAPLMLHTGGGFGVEMNSKFLCCAILEHVLIIFKLILRTQFADMPPNIASKVHTHTCGVAAAGGVDDGGVVQQLAVVWCRW